MSATTRGVFFFFIFFPSKTLLAHRTLLPSSRYIPGSLFITSSWRMAVDILYFTVMIYQGELDDNFLVTHTHRPSTLVVVHFISSWYTSTRIDWRGKTKIQLIFYYYYYFSIREEIVIIVVVILSRRLINDRIPTMEEEGGKERRF